MTDNKSAPANFPIGHKPEHRKWLVETVVEMVRTGAAKTVSEALSAVAAEWGQLTGRPCKPNSLRGILEKAALRMNVQLPLQPRRFRNADGDLIAGAPAPTLTTVNAEEVAHAGYAVWIPARNGTPDSFKLLGTPGEVSHLINELVSTNLGFMPPGIKIFGEIVPEVDVQIRWKNRGMPTIGANQNGGPK